MGGMTAKVLKGSFWVLLGQVIPLLATFIASPFVIRLLGSEAYGVLILVGLVSTYFSFADFGMAMTSTRFGSEAYASGSADKEGKVIRTSALIGVCSSLIIAIPMFVFSSWIVGDLLNVPEYLQPQASIALKFTSAAFVVSIIGNIFNTPQLSRLRMDLNVGINAGIKILMTSSTPVVLYLGGGIVDATIVAFTAAFLIMALHIIASGRLQPAIYGLTIDKKMVKPLMKFGGNIVLYAIGLAIINNLEKLLLTRFVSVKSLAYYSVASTFANMTSMFSVAIVQTLIPAFSQLLAPEKRSELNSLFARTLRLNLITLLPSIMFLLVIAKPFFTIWAGKEFGEESIFPFYLLLPGIFFNMVAYIPNCILLSSGRSDLFARFYLIEVVPYTLFSYFLITQFGILGAAMSWSIREIVNALFFINCVKKYTMVSFQLSGHIKNYLLAFLVLVPTAVFALFYDNFSLWLLLLIPAGIALYLSVVWKKLIDPKEKVWVTQRVNKILRRNTADPAGSDN